MSNLKRRITFKLTYSEADALGKLLDASPKWVNMQHFIRLAVLEKLEEEIGPVERAVSPVTR